jgi:hypothetical protein
LSGFHDGHPLSGASLICLSGKSASAGRGASHPRAANALRQNRNFASQFNVIWVVQIAQQK